MERKVIRRALRAAAALGVLATFTLVPATASASGGGGCGRPVTEATGTAVGLRGFCFRPTILRVAVGTTVTFTNQDPAPHVVLGANGSWGGYDTLRRGRDVQYRFTEDGVYPYVCTYHPGMIGVVVAGNGDGGAIDTTTATGPVIRIERPIAEFENAAVVATTRAHPEGGSGRWPALGLGAFALLAVGGAAGIRRHRRRSLA